MPVMANSFVKRLKKFSELIMEGDFKKFDLTVPYQIKHAVCTVIVEVLEHCGYNQAQLNLARGLLSDILNPVINLNGDIFSCAGVILSGAYATAEFNSLVVLMLLMYYFYKHEEMKDLNFFDYVLPNTYGDDLVASVSEKISKWYNNRKFSEFCSSEYLMTYTSASKSEIDSDFLSIDDMSFLKRRFVYNNTFKRYVAQLDINSIFKSLTLHIPSKSIALREQMEGTLNSALLEMFFHLEKNQFNWFRSEIIKIYSKHFNVPVGYEHRFKDWEEIRQIWGFEV
jgi:hypothetical protein